MVLQTQRLLLHPLTLEQLYAARWRLPQVVAALGGHADPAGFWARWEKRRIYQAKAEIIECYPDAWLLSTMFILLLRDGGDMVGEVGFKGPPFEEETIEIGYGTLEPYRRQGYMTEAVEAMVAYAFSQSRYAVQSIKALTLGGNTASHRVLEKNGFACVDRTGKHWKWLRTRQGSRREERV